MEEEVEEVEEEEARVELVQDEEVPGGGAPRGRLAPAPATGWRRRCWGRRWRRRWRWRTRKKGKMAMRS